MYPAIGSVPNSGASHYPPSFSNYYNPNMGQQNFGTQAMAGVMGGMQSLPGIAGGIGLAGSLGLLGSSLGLYGLGTGASKLLGAASAFDPIGMGIRMGAGGMNLGRGLMTLGGLGGIGTGTFGGAMGTIGAGLGGAAFAAVPAAAMYAAYKGVSAFGEGGVHQAEINRMFSGYNFANPSALGGRGFSAAQMGTIGDAMHSINASSNFISGGDAMQLTKQFQQMGLGRGADSVGDLTTKLKEFGRVADEVAQKMGTSITQVSGLIQQMRGNGFFSSSEISNNVTSMRTMESMGVSNEQFMGAQRQGGATAMGMGLTNVAGSKFMSAAGGQMVSALESGFMDRQQMMRLTGTEHYADAGMAFASKMQSSMGNFMRSGVGRAFLAGIGQTQGGKFTGKIDESMLDKLSAGGDFTSIMDRGRSSLQGRDAGRSFMTNQDAMLNNLMGSEQGLTSVVGAITSMGEKADLGSGEDAFVLLGNRMQMGTELELRELYKFAQKQKQIRRQMTRKAAEELSAEQFQLKMSRQKFSGKVAGAMGYMSDQLMAPIMHSGAATYTAGADMFERMDMALGEYISEVSRDQFNVSDHSIRDVNRRLSMGEQVRSATTDRSVERVMMAGDSHFTAFVDADYVGRDAGALNTSNGARALMIQRAAATRDFKELTDLVGAGLPKKRKAELDASIRNVDADPDITDLIGKAREAKLSGDPDALAERMEEIKGTMLSKGIIKPGASAHEMQYLLSKVGGEDVVAKDLANATLTIKGGGTRMEKEDREFKKAIMGGKGMSGAGHGYGVAGGALGGAAVGGSMFLGGAAMMISSLGMSGLTGTALATTGAYVSGLAAVGAGSKLGAALGSSVPILGTLVGAAIGAAAGYALHEYMKPEEQKVMEKIMDKGEGVDLMGSLKSPAEVAEFNQILEEYKKNFEDEDEAYEEAAKTFSAKYGKKITASDVRTTDKAMEHMSGKNSHARSKMTVEEISKDKGLKQLMGYTRFKADTKARAKINDKMLDTLTKNRSGIVGEADFIAALGEKEGEGKDARMKASLRKMIDSAVESGDFTATDSDPILRRAIAQAVTVRKEFGKIEGDISEEELVKKSGGALTIEDIQAFRKGKTGLISKDELNKMSEDLAEFTARDILAEGGKGGMITGGEFGSEAEMQTESLKKTAFMIDALYAKATGTDPSTAGGQRVLTQMNNSKPDGN